MSIKLSEWTVRPMSYGTRDEHASTFNQHYLNHGSITTNSIEQHIATTMQEKHHDDNDHINENIMGSGTNRKMRT